MLKAALEADLVEREERVAAWLLAPKLEGIMRRIFAVKASRQGFRCDRIKRPHNLLFKHRSLCTYRLRRAVKLYTAISPSCHLGASPHAYYGVKSAVR
jgi:hypothetical protein